jgi:hypothetical protein
MMQQQQTTFLVEDETKLVDRYLTRNPREVTLLAKVKKLYIYIRGQADNSNCPATFEDFYDWIGPNQLVVNQLASRYFNDVVIELDRKAIYKYCKDHLQIFKTWGIMLDPKIVTNVEHRQKTIWRPLAKQNKQSSDALKRSINAELIGKDSIRNCVDKLGELDVKWFRNCLQNSTSQYLKRFTNETAGRGKSDAQLRLTMLMVRAVISYASRTGIRSINFMGFNLDKLTFADNSMVFEYTNGKNKSNVCFINTVLSANANDCAVRHLSEYLGLLSLSNEQGQDFPFQLFTGGDGYRRLTEAQTMLRHFVRVLFAQFELNWKSADGTKPLHMFRYIVRNQLESQRVRNADSSHFQNWDKEGGVQDTYYTDHKARAINNPASFAISGRGVDGQTPAAPMYDYLDRVPTELLLPGMPKLLAKVLVLSMASGVSSPALVSCFPTITGNEYFASFSKELKAYVAKASKRAKLDADQSNVGLKRRNRELEMEIAQLRAAAMPPPPPVSSVGPDSDDVDSDATSVISCEEPLAKRLCAPAVWTADHIKASLARLHGLDKKSVEFVQAVVKAFDETLLPAMQVLSRDDGFGLAKRSTEGKQLMDNIVLAALLKKLGLDGLLKAKVKADASLQRGSVQTWTGFANRHRQAYGINTSKLSLLIKSFGLYHTI